MQITRKLYRLRFLRQVAEQLINPFGEDDDDYNINWIIDRNMQVSLLVVDDMHGVMPHAEKDIYFGESPPEFLPYTKSSINSLRPPYMGSTANLRSVTRTVVQLAYVNFNVTFHKLLKES